MVEKSNADLPITPETHGGERFIPASLKTFDGELVARTVQTIARDAGELYALWRDVEQCPHWQEMVVSVQKLDERKSRWVMGAPEDAADPKAKRFEFDSEIVKDIPCQQIAWRSITEGISMKGTVQFVAAPGNLGTRVLLAQRLPLPGGVLGNAIAGWVKRSPRQ